MSLNRKCAVGQLNRLHQVSENMDGTMEGLVSSLTLPLPLFLRKQLECFHLRLLHKKCLTGTFWLPIVCPDPFPVLGTGDASQSRHHAGGTK